MASKKCKAKTKAGKSCKARGVMDNGFCMAHQPEDEKESRGFGGSQPNAGRPRLPTPIELKRKVIEDNVEKFLAPYLKTLGYEIDWDDEGNAELVRTEDGPAVLTASFQGHVSASDIEDLGAQVEVIEKLLNRVYGKPMQQTEVSGSLEVSGAPDLSNLTDKELEQWEALQRKATGR